MAEFKFNTAIKKTEWLVEGLLPTGQLGIILAQAGVGKSLLVENLAVQIVYGESFCGFNTVSGDVLIIDQDTPENVLYKRLLQFSYQYNGVERQNKLFIESMKNYTLQDESIFALINDHPTVKLVIIDSLHSVCGKLNPNYTSDMSRLSILKKKCLRDDISILVNHHITQKEILSIDALMLGETNHLFMGNSAIIQQADSYYIVGATVEEGRANRIYVRPVSKRVSIPSKPVILRVVPTAEGETLAYEGIYEPELEDAEIDIITLFREQAIDRTVKEIYEAMGHKHGEIVVRKSLNDLEKKGKLLLNRHKHDMFKYRLP